MTERKYSYEDSQETKLLAAQVDSMVEIYNAKLRENKNPDEVDPELIRLFVELKTAKASLDLSRNFDYMRAFEAAEGRKFRASDSRELLKEVPIHKKTVWLTDYPDLVDYAIAQTMVMAYTYYGKATNGAFESKTALKAMWDKHMYDSVKEKIASIIALKEV